MPFSMRSIRFCLLLPTNRQLWQSLKAAAEAAENELDRFDWVVARILLREGQEQFLTADASNKPMTNELNA